MSRLRLPAAVSAALLALVGVLFASPAHAAPVDPSSGTVIVRVVHEGTDLDPRSQVAVSLWKLDPDTRRYVYQPDVSWHPSGQGASFESSDLAPGHYSVRFLASDESIGLQWYQDARYFFESSDAAVTAGQASVLATAQLEDRTFDVGRIAGASRYDTAVAASRTIIGDGVRAPIVYLANGLTYPDALAAGPAAIAHGGSLLLTAADALPAATRAELTRIDPVKLVIAGGTGAISAAVEQELSRLLPHTDIVRLGGASRYETSALIVDDAFGASDAAIIATGRNFPDALAAGAVAGLLGAPVILVDGAAREVDAATVSLLSSLGTTHLIVLGGESVVSQGIERSLTERGFIGDHLLRFGGTSRYETAGLLNGYFFDATDMSFLASGTGFADALAGTPVAGYFGAPLYLTPQNCLNPMAASGIWYNHSNGVFLLGGPGALSDAVANFEPCA